MVETKSVLAALPSLAAAAARTAEALVAQVATDAPPPLRRSIALAQTQTARRR
jgi:hypothetical protein